MADVFSQAGAEFQINQTSSGTQYGPSMALLVGGNYVVVWTTFQNGSADTYGRLFTPAGVPVGNEFPVITQAGDQVGPVVAAHGGGGFVVSDAIVPAPNSGFDLSMFNSAGVAITATNVTSSPDVLSVAVSGRSDGGFVAVFAVQGVDGNGWGVIAQRFAATGSAVGSSIPVNTFVTGSQWEPAIAGLSNGGFVVTWESVGQDGDNSGIYAQRFDAAGSPLGGEFHVSTETASRQAYPKIATLQDGGFVIAWESFGQDGSSWGIYAQRFDSAGQPAGGEFRVNTTTAGDQSVIGLTQLSGGDIVVAWTGDNEDGDGRGIFAQVLSATGVPQGREFLVNTFTAGDQSNPAIVALPNNEFTIAWSSDGQDGSSFGVFAQRFAPTTGISDIALSDNSFLEDSINQMAVATLSTTGSETSTITYELVSDGSGNGFRIEGDLLIVNNNQALDFETAPNVTLKIKATDEAGNSYVEDIVVSILDSTVEQRLTAGDEFQVNTWTTSDQGDPAIARLSDGTAIVVWASRDQDGDLLGVYGQHYDASGVRIGGEFLVNTTTAQVQGNPSITALPGGGFVVGWSSYAQDGDDSGVYAQRFDNALSKLGGEFRVNTQTVDTQSGAAVSSLADGGFVFVWHSFQQDGPFNAGIYGQRYNAAGLPMGGEFRVNSTLPDSQLGPEVAGLAGGGFVVVWQSENQDGNGQGVFARRFDANGLPLADDFQVNMFTGLDQDSVAIAALTGGGFVITWASDFQDGDISGVYARQYNAAGAAMGAEFRANTTTKDAQSLPDVTGLDDGGYVISWDSHGNDGSSFGIFSQRYDAAGNPLGSEFQTNVRTSGAQQDPVTGRFGNQGFMVAWTSEAQDGDGDGVYARVFQAFANQPPKALPDAYALGEDATLVVNVANGVLANDSDAEGDPLSAQLVTGPAHGTLTLNPDGSFTYKPTGNYGGTDSFVYGAFDGTTATKATVTLTVTAVNDPPIAVADTITTFSGLAIDVVSDLLLVNDSDPDGDRLHLDSTYYATHGTVTTLVSGGAILFTPQPGFSGIAGFDYSISDGRGGTASAHVTVNVLAAQPGNRAPVVTPSNEQLATLKGTPIAFTVAASDPDGDALSYSHGLAAHGALTGGAGGAFSYTPATGFLGEDTFTIRASDGRGGQAEQTVTVNVLPPLDLDPSWRLFAESGFVGEVGESGTVFGSTGKQDIAVLDLAGRITFDPSFNLSGDVVRLHGPAAHWHVLLSGSNAVFSDGDTIVTIPVGLAGMPVAFGDGVRELAYDGAVKIGGQTVTGTFQPVTAPSEGAAPVAGSATGAARLLIDEGGSASAGGPLTVIGSVGSQHLHLTRGTVTLDPSFNRGGDTVTLDGATASFSARLLGSSVMIDGLSVHVSIPVGSNGLTLDFSDADHVLIRNELSGATLIGDQTITSTAAALTFA